MASLSDKADVSENIGPNKGKETTEAAEEFLAKSSAKSGSELSNGATASSPIGFERSPSTWRSPILMVMMLGICGWLLFSMKSELDYFLTDSTPIDLGNIDSYDFSNVMPNAFVKIEGLPHLMQAQYKQMGKQYRIFQLIGARVFVREPLVERQLGQDEYPTFSGQGRLLSLQDERAYANVQRFFSERGRYDFSSPAWVLLVDVTPASYWWVPVVYVILGMVFLLNAFLLARNVFFRRSRG